MSLQAKRSRQGKHRNKGIFVEGCPPLETQPTWAIADRKYETPMESERDYEEETDIFKDYAQKAKVKTGPKAEGKKS